MLPHLPVEIWLSIIDELGAQREYDALEACAAFTVGVLQERAQTYIPDTMTFRTREEVVSIVLRRRWEGPQTVNIVGGTRRGERLPIPHLATFASRLAGNWTHADTLMIERAEWRGQDLDLHSVLLDLALFDRIGWLHLYEVTFPTVLSFWRLVYTFPRLNSLHLYDVDIIKADIDARTLAALHLLPARRNLNRMYLLPPAESSDERPASLAAHSAAGLLQVIIAQAVPSFETCPWRNIEHLHFGDVTLPTAAAFGRLLCALPALRELAIYGPCIFAEHGFNSSDVRILAGAPSRLARVDLGADFSTQSNPQSVHEVVDVLVHCSASRRLKHIAAWPSPSLRVLTSIDVSLNRLVKHAGQSLESLTLAALPQGSLPLSNDVSTCAFPSAGVSCNMIFPSLLTVIHHPSSPMF